MQTVETSATSDHLDTIISTDNISELVKIDVCLNSSWTERAVEHGSYKCLHYLLTEQHVRLSQYAFLRAVERGDFTLFKLHGFKLDTKEMLYDLLVTAYRYEQLEMFKYLVDTYIIHRYAPRRVLHNIVKHLLDDPFSTLRGDEYLAKLIDTKAVNPRELLCRTDLLKGMYISKRTLQQAITEDVKIHDSGNRFPRSFFLTKKLRTEHKKVIQYYASIGIEFRHKYLKVKLW